MAMPFLGKFYMGSILFSAVGSIIFAIVAGIIGWFIWSKVREKRREMMEDVIKGGKEEKETKED